LKPNVQAIGDKTVKLFGPEDSSLIQERLPTTKADLARLSDELWRKRKLKRKLTRKLKH